MGHLVFSGGALTADVVESEVNASTIVAAAPALSASQSELRFSCRPPLPAPPSSQVKRSLEWLQRSQSDSRRYAAVLILREMAENAPAVFNVHVRAFIDAIWSALRDPKIHVRDAAVAALSVRAASSCPR